MKSKTARLKLKPRRKPYYHQISRGIALGYTRVARGVGSWQVHRLVEGQYRYETIGEADDHGLPDEKRKILSFEQAQRIAIAPAVNSTRLTVAGAMVAYLADLASRRSDSSAV